MKEFKIRKVDLVIITFPSIVMSLITITSSSLMTKNFYFDWKGIFIISIILGFPLLFLIQGIISTLRKTNIFLTLGVSLLTLLILMITCLNSSASIYILIYSILWFIGYGIGYGISKGC